jgi:hypothetical protein
VFAVVLALLRLLSLQLAVGRAFASHGPRLLGGIDGCGRYQRVFGTGAGYSPTIVVQKQVMVSAKEDAVRDVRSAVISIPVGDVVGFAPGGWPFAVAEAATAVSDGEGDALRFGEHPLFSTDVEWLKVVVESDF